MRMSQHCIWYVSKYVALPGESSAGGRGYLIMQELAQLGHTCVIITSDSNKLATVPVLKEPYLFQERDGLTVCWVRTMKYSVAKSVRRISSWLHFEWRLFLLPKKKLAVPDVVIVSSLSLLTILNGFLLRWRFGCRLVFEIRDIWPLTIVEEGGISIYNPLVHILAVIERLGYRYADAIVGTMPNLQEHVAGVLGYEKKVWCVPMGVDRALLVDSNEIPKNYREKYIAPGKFIVAHVGSMGITNALDAFLACAESLVDNKDIHFLLVGEGDLKKGYQEKYGYLDNLTFAPKVPKGVVQSILRASDLLYFSTHTSKVWKYGQSLNKVIDYMLSGRPVLASYSGFQTMINEAACGSYVPSGDVAALREEILRYSRMPEADRRMIGGRGREWILKYRDYSVLAKNYLELLFPDKAPDEDSAA